ncbi:folate-binding protein [Rhodoplanes sp. TEM]|uniref:Folate-binding protein n=1 Tax=Rhodoplanes tepidamans TaxID=200616 RepID=A0ABT5JB92_RHOTP|nr:MULTISPECIES: folate-binding protein [Rhodoplanes]MDC7786818.1 folate-binding protein [Rhodoplanes tepidamans]MDC7985982.1 folate-binding protein [Rhodoplanes sp. TEM]MDQ0355945.1 folate-binding protein YgfZ [Rhodoplanes tepidamans]
MQAAPLTDRGVVLVSGDDARHFLNGLVTANVATMSAATPRFAALLTPQGKIVVDFIVVEIPAEDGGGFLLDVPAALLDGLLTKLKFYKLRAKVTVEDRSAALAILGLWGDGVDATDAGAVDGLVIPDPRLPALGLRAVVPAGTAAAVAGTLGATLADAADYEAHRVALGVPRGGVDFAYGDAFPHETDMDQLAGVDFKKGCYVGQEVVSRMQHRGTARSRVVPVAVDGFPPPPGTPVTAGEIAVGTMGSGTQGRGLALLRLDRVGDALAAGTPLIAGGIALAPRKPAWATFAWPGETADAS